jgi:hypothetical protein
MFGRFDARLRRLEALSPDRTWLHESGLASLLVYAQLGVKPSRPAVPASSARCRNVLRLTGRACWRVMGTSLLQMPVRTTPRTQASGRFFHGMNGRSTSASGEPRLVSAPYATSDNGGYGNHARHDRGGCALRPRNGRLPSAYSIPASRASPSHRWRKLTLAGFASPSFPTAR